MYVTQVSNKHSILLEMSNYESHYEQHIIANSYAYGKLYIVKLLLIYQNYCQFFFH